MSLYIRYFSKEYLAANVDDALHFLYSIPEIPMTPEMEADIRDYAAGDNYYPKRYKIRPRVYFIIIKSNATTMQEFKEKKNMRGSADNGSSRRDLAANAASRLTEYRPGWYEGELNFKRVVLIPATSKHEYRDTRFVAQCKAESGQECYNRIVDHLRQCVDPRSQFPSAKGKNFHFKYLGMWK